MKFSIITCTFNSQKYLSACFESIVSQTARNFEVIVVDGYSSDGTSDIIKTFQKSLPIKICQQKPSGISSAMNLGIKKAKGEYLLHLHSDDMLHDKNVLRDVDNYLKHRELDWIYGKIEIIEDNSSSFGVFPKQWLFHLNWNYLLKYTNFIPHQSVFIKKNVFDSLGYFDETLSSQMDTDLWLRIAYKTKWKFFNRIISKYRLHSNSQSSGIDNNQINQSNYEKVIRRYTNPAEFLLARVIDGLINKNNKHLR